MTLYTIAEAAAVLRCCTKTVRTLIQRGDLRIKRVGSRVRISDAALKAYLARRP